MSVFSRFLVRTALSSGSARRYVGAALALSGVVAFASAIRVRRVKRALQRSQGTVDAATKRLPAAEHEARHPSALEMSTVASAAHRPISHDANLGKTSLSAGIGGQIFEAPVPAR